MVPTSYEDTFFLAFLKKEGKKEGLLHTLKIVLSVHSELYFLKFLCNIYSIDINLPIIPHRKKLRIIASMSQIVNYIWNKVT